MDLYGQVPFRPVETYNGVGPSNVSQAADAIDTLVTVLTAIIPQLSAANSPYKASPDAARFLLMKVLLNKQSYLNRATHAAADPADMATVISLGQAIISSGNYSLTPHYFDNFGPNNGGADPGYGWGPGKEMILAYPNLPGVASNGGIGSGGIDARWMMTLHYNSNGHPGDGVYGGAGWNGFSTVADFYNAFDASDTMRRGNVYLSWQTFLTKSDLKVGFYEGQQLDEHGANRVSDRNGNPLSFNPQV